MLLFDDAVTLSRILAKINLVACERVNEDLFPLAAHTIEPITCVWVHPGRILLLALAEPAYRGLLICPSKYFVRHMPSVRFVCGGELAEKKRSL